MNNSYKTLLKKISIKKPKIKNIIKLYILILKKLELLYIRLL